MVTKQDILEALPNAHEAVIQMILETEPKTWDDVLMATRVVTLFASALSTAYDMGATLTPISDLAELHIASLQALADIVSDDVEDRKNQ